MRLIQMYLADLKELLENREFVSARAALRVISPVDLADGWEHFKPEERVVLFKLSPRQKALQLFEELDPPHQQDLLSALKHEEVEELVTDLDPTETGRLLRGLPKPMVRHLESILHKSEFQEKVKAYMDFPAESVGALMRSNYLEIEPKWTCRQALDRVSRGTRLRYIENTFLDTLFVVEPFGRLLGTVKLKQLVVAPPDMPVRDLMDEHPHTLGPEMDREEAAKLFSRYKLRSAAVVDKDGKMLGVVLYQDIVEVIEQETEEDFAKMAGTDAGAFEERTAWRLARLRLPWLAVTCVGQLLVSMVIRGFEDALSRMVALATFMPLIAAMGGNVGSQSAIVVVRALSTGEITQKDGRKTVLRDLRVGVLVGLVYSGLMVFFAQAFYGQRFGRDFAFVIGLGTLLSMSVAATLGSLVPFLFRRLGIDPATATGPLVTTLTDFISTASYLTLASYLLLG